MMTLFGSTLTASWPWFLLAIPCASVLLVYIFRARGSAQPRIVSSLFILRKLPSYLPHRKRFVPPLQFWLELFAFLALALAASGIVSRSSGSRIAVVIDTSKSMGALQPTGETRLQTAVRVAAADIGQSGVSDRFAVFSASSALTALSAESSSDRFVSARSSRAILQSIEPGYATDRLASVVSPLVASRDYDSVWVYTDKVLEQDPVTPGVRVVTVPSDPEAQSNVWIESVRLEQATPESLAKSAGRAKLSVALSAVGKSVASVEVAGECFVSPGGKPAPLAARTVQVPLQTVTTVSLEPLPPSWGYCRVWLQASSPDSLALDNEAWITHASERSPIVLHASLSAAELGLTALPYSIATAAEVASTAMAGNAIYHRTVPKPGPLGGASLVVFPPPTKSLFEKGAVSAPRSEAGRGSEVTRWSEAHPILQYVQPTLLSFPSVSILACPETSKPILFAAEGPIACAGERSGSRYVVTGFELFPFDGLRSPTVSIFTLNAMRWLFQSSAAASQSETLVGAVILPYEASRVQIVAPRTQLLASATTNSVLVDVPGVLALARSDTGNDSTTFVAVNAFSREESDLSRQQTLSISGRAELNTKSAATYAESSQGAPLDWFFGVALLVVLALDVIRRVVVRAQWGGSV